MSAKTETIEAGVEQVKISASSEASWSDSSLHCFRNKDKSGTWYMLSSEKVYLGFV